MDVFVAVSFCHHVCRESTPMKPLVSNIESHPTQNIWQLQVQVSLRSLCSEVEHAQNALCGAERNAKANACQAWSFEKSNYAVRIIQDEVVVIHKWQSKSLRNQL